MLEQVDAVSIAEAFGLGRGAELEGPVARGWLGQIWRLTTEHGVYAVKEATSTNEVDSDVEHLEESAGYQEAVAATGVLVPAVVRTVDGAVAGEIRGSLCRVYEWVDLAEADPMLDPVEIGRLLAAIHRVQIPDDRPVDDWFTDPIGVDRWDEVIAAVTAADAPFASRLAGLRDELVALETLLAAPDGPLQTCHRDLWADNVRASPAGVCVFDWDNLGPESPSQELAMVLFEFGRAPARAQALLAAYRDAGGLGRLRGPSDFTMLIAVLGHIGELACEEWLEAASAEERQVAHGRVEEFIDVPLTRATIADLLDVSQSG